MSFPTVGMTNNILTGFVNREDHILNCRRATATIRERCPDYGSGLTQLLGASREAVLTYQIIRVVRFTGGHSIIRGAGRVRLQAILPLRLDGYFNSTPRIDKSSCICVLPLHV